MTGVAAFHHQLTAAVVPLAPLVQLHLAANARKQLALQVHTGLEMESGQCNGARPTDEPRYVSKSSQHTKE